MKRRRGLFIFLCVLAFIVSFIGSAVVKLTYKSPAFKKYTVKWDDSIGTIHKDLEYGSEPANKFDLYLPKDSSKKKYGLIVYLHPGGFRTGDKSGDAAILEWLCSLGYVTAGVNYTLNSDTNPDANVYTMSLDVNNAMPKVVEEAGKFGYHIDRMAVAGGSAGGCLALLYAYRDAKSSPVPVKMVFEGVGPSSFYPEDWKSYGLDQNPEAAASFFTMMTGQKITKDMFGTKAYDDLVKPASALLWVDKDTVPTVMAYGKYDTFQPYDGSVRLDKALTEAGVDHKYFVFEHSGHGLQNDDAMMLKYDEAIVEYLNKYMAE